MGFDASHDATATHGNAALVAAGTGQARPVPETPAEAVSVLRLTGVNKAYGSTHAVRDVSVSIRPGEMVAIAGHNGAGKTTLVKAIGGIIQRTSGSLCVNGAEVPAEYDAQIARSLGIALALQEISLFPELRVLEHYGVGQRARVGLGWRRRAAAVVEARLGEMFPSHGISPYSLVGSLSLAQRQMLQIALASITDAPLGLLILDEPTSSLNDGLSAQLFEYLRRARAEQELSVVLVSHKMADIFQHTERTIVMRDGAIVSDRPTASLTLAQVMHDMGATADVVSKTRGAGRSEGRRAQRTAPVSTAGPTARLDHLTYHGLKDVSITVEPGEVVGLAGPEANGQRQVLEAVWNARRRLTGPQLRARATVRGRVAYVSGDRQEQGIFGLWSVEDNLVAGALDKVSRFGVLDPAKVREQAVRWAKHLSMKAATTDSINSLSGGTQQKVLLARGLAQEPALLLLDDPFRGVDVTTKTDAYARLREFADAGGCVLWYTSENAELLECDRVYVMRGHALSAELGTDEINAEQLIVRSFAETTESED